jgi:putative aldouronate transport system permease protein
MVNYTLKRRKRYAFSSDTVFDIFDYLFFSLILLVTLYPLYWVVIASMSNPEDIMLGRVLFIPSQMNFQGYKLILQYSRLWMGYRNSLLYAVVGTLVSLSLILPAGYVSSRKDFVGRRFFLIMITITMFFGGGLIPTYLVVKGLGMDNTIWAIVIPGACGAYNILVAKSFFQATIPGELLESASMDSCSNLRFFFRIALPLSLPLVAVITVFTAVGHWNSYFSALIYLHTDNLYPLQLILREILIQQDINRMLVDIRFMENQEERLRMGELVKYGIIIVASLPLLILYPFLQRFFVKGVMVGSLKG